MPDVWTVRAILDWIEGYLREHGDANPRLSAQWLVSDVLDCSRIQLYTDLDRPLTASERDVLRDYTRRRKDGEPLQYITGTTDFRFVTLAVEPGVLIPRPESEVLVSEALAAMREHAEGEAVLVADLCTGSGNIACSIASEVPDARVLAVDISSQACALARRNVERLGLADRVRVVECDAACAFSNDDVDGLDLVVSNPPYIPTSVIEALDAEVRDFEPLLALDGGSDGLDIFRRIVGPSFEALAQDGVFAVELHEACLDDARSIAFETGFSDVRIAYDLAGRPRVLVARKRRPGE